MLRFGYNCVELLEQFYSSYSPIKFKEIVIIMIIITIIIIIIIIIVMMMMMITVE